jgi:uncharacterized protein YyaL (SSP411 family)
MLLLPTLLALAALAQKPKALPNETPPPPVRNHLRGSGSRYLLNHAGNAVDWYPWGAEAFAKAKREDKPIFLSIGYASCHWCHVMERESFEDETLANFINFAFVPVLVDRGERPDVDTTYMAFAAAVNDGSAGWPANLVLTPDLSPISGSSYLSHDALKAALSSIHEKWRNDRTSLLQSGASMLATARANAQPSGAAADVAPRIGDSLYQRLREWNDRENGGFGTAPKFPRPFAIDFLLRRAQNGDDASRKLAISALDALARGAIHDQIGGGFHRYTTDAAWRVPHFEKMLPDQALMSLLFLEAWQITKDDPYARVSKRALDYAIRSLRMKSGAFAAGEDSDSLVPRGGPALVEGAHYVWDRNEVTHLLGKDAGVINFMFDITRPNGNVPRLANSEAETRARYAMSKEELSQKVDAALAKLLLIRSHRPSPILDDTIVAGWNALMVSALARAGAAFEDQHYLYAANDAARFIDSKLYDAKAKKLTRGGGMPAMSEDYALVIQAYLDLFEASAQTRWLTRAIELQQIQDDLFWNGTTLRYDDGSTLPIALRAAVVERDGDLPSVSAVSASNLLRIAAITDSAPARAKANAIFRSYASRMQSAPGDFPLLISTYTASLTPPREIVIAGDAQSDAMKAMLRAVHQHHAPLRALLVVTNERSRNELAAYAPSVKEMKMIDDKPTAYVCENYSCKPPVNDLAKLEAMLK